MTKFSNKFKKPCFWPIFPIFGAKIIFFEKSALSRTTRQGPRVLEKTNEPIPRKLPDWKTERRTLIHRTLPATAGSPIITTFLALMLTLNNFIFNCKNPLQIKRWIIGTICASSFANIFMDNFENKFIYPIMKTILLICLRFIADIFLIWTGNKTDLLF